jgi:hypothetical protein
MLLLTHRADSDLVHQRRCGALRLLSVSGGAGTHVSFPSTGSFQTVGSIQRTVTLNVASHSATLNSSVDPHDLSTSIFASSPRTAPPQVTAATRHLGRRSEAFADLGDRLGLCQQSEFERKLFRWQKIWRRKLELSAIKPDALANYQRDQGLYTTSAIDEPTLASLGMA